jgi:ribulose-5-phosphate 4-epimerase/fuculose-1-phosphate aldolase
MISNLLKLAKEVSKHVVGYEGNISGRLNDGFYIKASGTSLVNLNEDSIVYCNFDGSYNNNNLRPSIETGFHRWIYQNTNVNYISHTHPVNTLKILCSRQAENFAKKRLFPDQVVFNGLESCLVDYYHPGEELLEAISIKIKYYLQKYNSVPKLILLKNHGVITLGDNIDQCVISTDICEKSAEIFLGSIFDPIYLKDSDTYKLDSDEKEKFRQKNEK